MKRFLLAIAGACLMSGMASAETWGLIGEFSDWASDVDMTMVGENEYSVTMESLQGEFKFRANHDWTVNFGNGSAITDIDGNGSLTMAANGMNFKASAALENVTLTINTSTQVLVVSGLTKDQSEPVVYESLYIVGDPAGGWATNTGLPMVATNGHTFTWTGYMVGPGYFGFVTELNDDNDWDAFNSHRYGPEEDGALVSVGGANPIYHTAGKAWRMEEAGDYTITVDLEAMTMSVSVYDDKTVWGVIGSFTEWGSDVNMTEVSEGVYKVTLENFSGEFKFRANGDWTENLGAVTEKQELISNGEFPLVSNGSNFDAPTVLNTVTLSIDVKNLVLTVSDINTSAIDVIEVAPDKTARYYNLQGVPVVDPTEGLYIRVNGNESRKVFVR